MKAKGIHKTESSKVVVKNSKVITESLKLIN